MMIEFTYSMLLDTIRTAGILVGIIYYLTIMRNQSKAREAQFLLQLNNVFQDKDAIKDWLDVLQMQFTDYDDFLEKFDSGVNMENYLQRSRIYRMLNTFGQILKKGLVNSETVFDGIQGDFIEDMWVKHSVVVFEVRERWNSPHYLEGFEYLAQEMKKIKDKRNK